MSNISDTTSPEAAQPPKSTDRQTEHGDDSRPVISVFGEDMEQSLLSPNHPHRLNT